MAVIATGFFDGVHLGHRQVIDTLVSCARERGEDAGVITFAKHPRTIFQKDARTLRLLSTLEEKVGLLKSLGVNDVHVLQFDRAFYSMTAREYLVMIREKFGATAVLMGYDNRLGSDTLLPEQVRPLASSLGLDLVVVPPLAAGDRAISSTLVRNTLMQGDVEAARAMLGYDYQVHGVVVSGKQLGRKLGFPTANMQLYEPLKLIPAKGVYLTEVYTQGRRFYGMTNVGDIIETHILDFSEDIYGLDIVLKYKKRLRDERRFESLDGLKAQLAIDEDICRELCEDLPRL